MVKAKPADPTATFHVSARFRQENQYRARLDREGEGKTFRDWPSPANGVGRPAGAGATERRCGGVLGRRGGATRVLSNQAERQSSNCPGDRASRAAAGVLLPTRGERPRGGTINRSAQRWGFFRKDEST